MVNLVFPRAGEPFRAGVISKTEKIPFQKRVWNHFGRRELVDVGMLGIVTLIMLGLQVGKLDLFQTKIDHFSVR